MGDAMKLWEAMERVNLGVAEAEDYAEIRRARAAARRQSIRRVVLGAVGIALFIAVLAMV
jgi:hypothetical protein